MRDSLRPAAVLAVVGLAALAACNKGTTISPDEQAIRNLDAQWLTAAQNKDVNGVAAMYAEDGGIYAPNEPPAIGHEAIVATWTNIMQLPGYSINFQPGKIVVAAGKDMAIDIGTYTLKTGDVNAPTVENGKYVVTWLKRADMWKVYTDMFSADTTPPPALPGAAAPAASAMPSVAPMGADNTMPGAATPTTQLGAPASTNGAPAASAPAPSSGQTMPPPVQQFGPVSPIQNAAPLVPGAPTANPASGPSKPATPSTGSSAAPTAPAPQQ